MAGEGEKNLTENVKCEWITEEVKVQVSEGGIFSKSYSFVEYIINTAVKKKKKAVSIAGSHHVSFKYRI